MPRKFKQARLINNRKMTEAAGKPGISQPTLSAWEGECKSAELQGWYHVEERYVHNEYGNNFYLDTYGIKWLAFIFK